MDEELELLKEKVKFLEEQLTTLKKRIEKYEQLKNNIGNEEVVIPKKENEIVKNDSPLTINEIEDDENHALDVEENVKLLATKYGQLRKIGKNTFITLDGSTGFVILNSKTYYKTNYLEYWYAYRERKFLDIKNCINQFLVLGFGNPLQMCVIPNTRMQELKDTLTYTADNSGTIRHYHLYLNEENGLITMRLSKPEVKKISLKNYLFK